MKSEWLPHALKNAPRYTSYPTAAQFNDRIGSEEVDAWMQSKPADDPISVYVHVPFCEKLCWYCGCHTTIPNGYRRIESFHKTLLEEIDLWADQLGDHAGAKHVHFGGGTPNALSAEDTLATLRALNRRFHFRSDAEIAAELDPRTLDPARIDAFTQGGLTRASLGVQDFNSKVQESINRVQPFDLVDDAVRRLRQSGIEKISFDLMYGLPHQTLETVIETAIEAIELNPDRISVFGYAHVPWFAKHQKAIDEAALPGVEARFDQYTAIGETLQAAGYVAIGLDHFAKPGDPLAVAMNEKRLRRNFQGYTDDSCETLVALGPSAISAFREGYAQNEKVTPKWAEAVSNGTLPVTRGVAVNSDDRLRRAAIQTLMCHMQVDLASVCHANNHPDHALDDALPALHQLEASGLCRLSGRNVDVPVAARAFLRTVAQCFDTYSPTDTLSEGRHARAV